MMCAQVFKQFKRLVNQFVRKKGSFTFLKKVKNSFLQRRELNLGLMGESHVS